MSSIRAHDQEPGPYYRAAHPHEEGARIIDVPEYLAPGVYVEETSYRSKSIEGVSTSARGFVGSIRRGVDASAKSMAVVVGGVFLGAALSVAVGKARRRRRRPPPTP